MGEGGTATRQTQPQQEAVKGHHRKSLTPRRCPMHGKFYWEEGEGKRGKKKRKKKREERKRECEHYHIERERGRRGEREREGEEKRREGEEFFLKGDFT